MLIVLKCRKAPHQERSGMLATYANDDQARLHMPRDGSRYHRRSFFRKRPDAGLQFNRSGNLPSLSKGASSEGTRVSDVSRGFFEDATGAPEGVITPG